MQTSERLRTLRRTVIAGSIAAMIALVISPADPAMAELTVHPAWVVALVLAARYGARGLYAVPAVVAGVVFAEWVAGRTELAMLIQLSELNVLAVLGTIVVLASVGEAHQARGVHLDGRLRFAERRAVDAEVAVAALSEAAIALRDRSDRSQTSLAFLSDIALRMDDADPNVAAQAVLDIAIARTGARGGFVQVFDSGRLRTLAARGPWSANQLLPPTVFRDRVALAALDHQALVAAHEVGTVSAEDSDLAAPLLSNQGSVVGVLAVRGIAYPALTAAAREDLAAVARWAGRSFARPRRGAGPVASAHRGGDRATT
jgi:hypothetical protein